jgi:glutamyl-tRNA synthetase
MVRVRFAPSPTGPLHIGGVRTALYNYLFARKNKGKLILRIEDTDQKRYVKGAEDYIIESLNWLGIQFDEGPHTGGDYGPYRQSERKPDYRQYADDLIEKGHAYYAFDTSEELNEMRERLEASKMMPKYDAISRSTMKNSLSLPEDEVKRRLASGDDFVIRIKLPRNEEVRFHDEIRGWVVVNTTQMDDKVLLKSDGMPTYHLANIVDDFKMEITHVIRGEEWLPSAPLHVMLYRYLGWEDKMPKFAHLPLLLKPDGNGKLSKRDGDRLGFPVFPLEWKDPSTEVVSTGYREEGYLPEAVLNMLALLGWHTEDNQELFPKDKLIEAFDISRVSKSGAKFDLKKAQWFNHHYLMQLANEQIASSIQDEVKIAYPSFDLSRLSAAVELTKEKAIFPSECYTNAPYLFQRPTLYDEKTVAKKWSSEMESAMQELVAHFKDTPSFIEADLDTLVESYALANDNKKFYYFPALRLVTTGAGGGPPLFKIFEFLGKQEVCARIEESILNLKQHA